MEVIDMLYKREFLNIQDTTDGDTPLHVYLKDSPDPQIKIIKKLITNENLEIMNNEQCTPYDYYFKYCKIFKSFDKDILWLLNNRSNVMKYNNIFQMAVCA
jgi:hypothetical protein